MAMLPTPEETAKEILAIFVNHFKCRPEDVLSIGNFLAVWHKRGLDSSDFNPGMEHAVSVGWVEVIPNGDAFKITAAGYAAA